MRPYSWMYTLPVISALFMVSLAFDAFSQNTQVLIDQPAVVQAEELNQPTPVSPSQNIETDLEQAKSLFQLGQHTEARLKVEAILLTAKTEPEALQLQRRLAIALDDEALLIRSLQALIQANHGDIERWKRELTTVGVTPPEQRVTAATSASNTPLSTRLRSALGLLVFLIIALAMSRDRKAVKLRLVAWGLGLQFLFAVLILRTPPGRIVFEYAKSFIEQVLALSDQGAGFIFGKLASGSSVTYIDAASGDPTSIGMVFAFQILPTVIFFGALMSVLYHLGIIQALVRGVATVMNKTMGTSGAESLSAAGNIFVGQTESPLIIKPYVDKMTRSELMAVMCGGFATVAGGVLAAYARFGIDPGHLLAASVMSAPAALVMAKIMEPETSLSDTADGQMKTSKAETSNILDAAASGASDGLALALNVAAMLIAFISLVALVDWMLGSLGVVIGLETLSLKWIFGWVFYPLSWCMGVDSQDLHAFGQLLGSKIAVNEFVAYIDLGRLSATMTERSTIIGTYALCGFANFSSIGIQMGGIGAIAPKRRKDLAALGLKAMVGGAFASWMTACVAGLLL